MLVILRRAAAWFCMAIVSVPIRTLPVHLGWFPAPARSELAAESISQVDLKIIIIIIIMTSFYSSHS